MCLDSIYLYASRIPHQKHEAQSTDCKTVLRQEVGRRNIEYYQRAIKHYLIILSCLYDIRINKQIMIHYCIEHVVY